MTWEYPLPIDQLFAFLLVFCRIGTAFMLMPGIGEMYVPPRIRLLFALAVSLIVAPTLVDTMPPIPASALTMTTLIAFESFIGLFLGMLTRTLIATLHIAGMIIAAQSGLSSAMLFDATQSSQGSAFGSFLSVMAVTIIFVGNLHYMMLAGVIDSYQLFAPGSTPPVHDFAQFTAQLISESFNVAFRISAPTVLAALLIYLGAGVLSRLMPTMQVFFVVIPLQILLSIAILTTSLSAVILWYAGYFEDTLGRFIGT